jgi:hypothetical protein
MLHVVLRVSPQTNGKSRPDWFSKSVCVKSVLLASRQATAVGLSTRVIVLADVKLGFQWSPELRELFDYVDSLVLIKGGSASKSWRAASRYAKSRLNLAPGDLVYFAEDDHLHARNAFETLPGPRGYRFLYSSPEDLPSTETEVQVGRRAWVKIGSGVSSFVVSGEDLRRDYWMLQFFSFSGPGWDEVTCRALGGGARNHLLTGWSYYFGPYRELDHNSWRGFLSATRRSFFRAAAEMASLLRPRSDIWGLNPPAAAHAEIEYLPVRGDWGALANEVTGCSLGRT